MNTYLLDIVPSLKRFSQKLDQLTRLTNQHWVLVDEIDRSKNIYIFRPNNELLISQNGKVEKAQWEYLGNNSILIDRKEESYLFKNGFLDENVLALKIDNRDEYALFVNENKYDGELNSVEKIISFLQATYLDSMLSLNDNNKSDLHTIKINTRFFKTDKGMIEVKTRLEAGYTYGDSVLLAGKLAPDGKYVYGWPSWSSYVEVKDGKLTRI